MPTVSRQRVASNGPALTRGKAAADDILADAIDVSTLAPPWIKFLVYGANGVGKTRLACTFPKPLLLVSFEPQDSGGATTVVQMGGIKLIRPGTIERAQKLAERLRAGDAICDLPDPRYNGKRYQSLVFDSVTSYQQMLLQELMGWDEPAVQVGFGDVPTDTYRNRAEHTKQCLRMWINLPYHTVFTGKEKDHNPPKEEKVNPNTGKVQPDMRPKFVRGIQQESAVSVDLGGGAAGWVLDAVPYFGRLYMDREMEAREVKGVGNAPATTRYVETGKFVRALRCSYHPNFAARFQSAADVPDEIVNPTYEKIAAVIAGQPMPEDGPPATKPATRPANRPTAR